MNNLTNLNVYLLNLILRYRMYTLENLNDIF